MLTTLVNAMQTVLVNIITLKYKNSNVNSAIVV